MTAQEWVEVCKVIGAGIAFVAVPAVVALWRQLLLERKERSEESKQTLEVLGKMNAVLGTVPAAQEKNVERLVDEMKELEGRLKEHIINHVKPGSRRTTP